MINLYAGSRGFAMSEPGTSSQLFLLAYLWEQLKGTHYCTVTNNCQAKCAALETS